MSEIRPEGCVGPHSMILSLGPVECRGLCYSNPEGYICYSYHMLPDGPGDDLGKKQP